MRSSWVLPFLHRTVAGGLVAHPSQGHQAVLSQRAKTGGQPRFQALARPIHPRFCLGIGDGTIRRQ